MNFGYIYLLMTCIDNLVLDLALVEYFGRILVGRDHVWSRQWILVLRSVDEKCDWGPIVRRSLRMTEIG